MFMFMEALFTTTKLRDLSRYRATSEYRKKMLHTQSSLSHPKERIVSPTKTKWMKPKITVLKNINQTQKDKYLIYVFLNVYVCEREKKAEGGLRGKGPVGEGQERVTEMIYLSVIGKAREIAWWITVLAVQALEPEFKSPGPTYKPSHDDTSACLQRQEYRGREEAC